MALPEKIDPRVWQLPRETRVRVRYAETDQMGVVYYTHYGIYSEIARTEWIRSFGLTYAELEQRWKVMLPVRSFAIQYHRPARYDDEIVIRTWLSEPPGTKLFFAHQLYRAEELLAEAQVLLIFVSKEIWKPCRPPDVFYAALAQANLA